VNHFGQHAEGSDQADVVRVVLDHHAGVWPKPVAVRCGGEWRGDVQRHGRPGVLVERRNVGCRQFLPPQTPRFTNMSV